MPTSPTPGECHILQKEHIEDIVSAWPENLGNVKKALAPGSNDLFNKGKGELLCDELWEILHSIVAKGLFVSNRSRPDVLPTISVLSSRVRNPNQSDWVKCCRFVKYLDSTRDLHLVLHYDDTSIVR